MGRKDSMKMRKAVILSVDDDPNDQLLIRTAFQEAGVNDPVQTVNDGAEAIAYLKGQGKYADRDTYLFPTFILTDLKMPRINGFELLRFLKSNPQLIVVPTVVLSASSDRDDIKRAYLFGANAYHVKSQTLEALCTQLKLVYDYWTSAEVPDVDRTGNLLPTQNSGKLSENVLPPPFRKDLNAANRPAGQTYLYLPT
jgi:CheY-like chemotaxis protein